ncbi:potassium-transporting ATPase subunit C [Candidatus Bipolaricaulota bacterium]|nr:potassium-transporting ATPase subunit C [Candidatus Bipolaricaulota bacterium]
MAPTSGKLTKRARNKVENLADNGVGRGQIPVSFVTESGSVLEPHIVPDSALLQVPRVSEATGIPEEKLIEIIDKIPGGSSSVSTDKKVNVLVLNLRVQELTGSGNHE